MERSDTLRGRVAACLLALVLAVTMCLTPYAQAKKAYAVVPVAAAAGYAIGAVLAVAGVSLTVGSTTDATALANEFEDWAKADIGLVNVKCQALMSAYVEAAKASGEKVEDVPASITMDDVNDLMQVLSDAGTAGTLALSKISPWAAAGVISPLPFLLQAFIDDTTVINPYTPSAGWTASTYPIGSVKTYEDSYTYTYSGSSTTYSFSIEQPGNDALSRFGKLVDGAEISSDYSSYYLVPVFALLGAVDDSAVRYVGINKSTYEDYFGSLDDFLSSITMSVLTWSFGKPNYLSFSAAGIGLTSLVYTPADGAVSLSNSFPASTVQTGNGVFSPYVNLTFTPEGKSGVANWSASQLTDNPDVNLGRDYWQDATSEVKGGIVVGSGVGGILGGGSVVSGGQVINRGSIAIPTNWGGVDSWADVLNKTGAAVGSDVYARNPAETATATGAAVDSAGVATGELTTGPFDTITNPDSDIKISIAAPVTTGNGGTIGGGTFALGDKFPFCIPSDLQKCVSALNGSAVAPVVNVPFWSPNGDWQSMEIDLAEYDSVASTLRGMFSLVIIVGAIYLAMQLIQMIRAATK